MSLQFVKLNVPAAYQVVSRELRRSIVAGDLKPGDKLPSEAELAEQFGVNRSTVREGIRQLENDGFVRREGRKRLCVSVPTSSDLAPRASWALVMHQVTFNRTAAQVAAVQDNIDRTRHSISNARLSTALDTEFQLLVAEGAHNHALLLSREPVGLLLYPAFDMLHPLLPQALGRMLQAHERIAAAIVAGDADGAELWMRKHIVDFRRGWEMAKLSLDAPVTLPGGIGEG